MCLPAELTSSLATLTLLLATGCGATVDVATGGSGGGATTGTAGGDSTTCPAATQLPTPSCDGYALGLTCSAGDEPPLACTCTQDAMGTKSWSCTVSTGPGGGGNTYTGIVAHEGLIPASNQPSPGLDPTTEVLELSPTFSCASAGTDAFDCDHVGRAFAFTSGPLKVGSYDLSTMPGFEYRWLGTCSDGGGGRLSIVSGTLVVTTADATHVEGSVHDLAEVEGGSVTQQMPFAFSATRCQ